MKAHERLFMENETILTADQSATTSGDEVNQTDGDSSTQGTRKMIPIPADKFREMNRELSSLRAATRGSNLSTSTSKVPLTKEQEDALDLIADRTAGRFTDDLSAVRSEMDSISLENRLNRLQQEDPNIGSYLPEMQEELLKLQKENPNVSPNSLVDQAHDRAIARAYRAGKLTQSIADEVNDQALTKTRLGGSRQGSASTRGKQEVTFDQMSAEELAASGKVDEYFAQTQGRSPRR